MRRCGVVLLGFGIGGETRDYKALRADDAQSLQDPEEALRMSGNVQYEADWGSV